MSMITPAAEASQHFRKGERCILLIMGERYLVTLLEVDEEKLRVTYPSAHFPVEGMYVILEFHDEEGFSTYESEVLETPKDYGDGLVLKRPHADVRASHRRTWRAPAGFNAEIKAHVHPKRQNVKVIDVSAGGMQIESGGDWGLGHNLDIEFDLPGRGHHKVLGVVAHILRREDTQRIGVRFINPEPETTHALVEYIWLQIHRTHPEARHPMLKR
jgi:c-di-GMP-binding flagellar brake protein YcgR